MSVLSHWDGKDGCASSTAPGTCCALDALQCFPLSSAPGLAKARASLVV